VYQTNHGAAHDLAGKNVVNPVGQIFALAMLLRESFGMLEASCVVEQAVSQVWRQGWRTRDLEEPGCRLAGTREMGSLVADAVLSISRGIKV
jgi:3-isopropylmalate dehydrogenase